MFLLFSIGLLSTIFLSGCAGAGTTTNSVDAEKVGLEEKNTEITLTGTLSGSEQGYFITDGAGKIHSVESYSVDFTSLVGKQVVAVGQYSGDTLFATTLTAQQ